MKRTQVIDLKSHNREWVRGVAIDLQRSGYDVTYEDNWELGNWVGHLTASKELGGACQPTWRREE